MIVKYMEALQGEAIHYTGDKEELQNWLGDKYDVYVYYNQTCIVYKGCREDDVITSISEGKWLTMVDFEGKTFLVVRSDKSFTENCLKINEDSIAGADDV